MDIHVPAAFLPVTSCYASEYQEDGTFEIVLCTTSGQLLQFKEKKVMGSLDLNQDADDILVFTSYNPLQKYYLVRCQELLLVVKKSKPLCVIKTLRDVVQVQIEDKLQLGWPQAIVWTKNSTEPLITDFVGELHPSNPQPVPPLTLGLNGKLQELNERLAKASRLLQEKRTARVKAQYSLTPQLTPPGTQAEVEKKVVAWGPSFPTQTKAAAPPLKLNQPWCKVHNGRLILGFPVFNNSDSEVSSVRLRLLPDSVEDLDYQTRVYVFPRAEHRSWLEPAEHRPLFTAQAVIPARTSAAVLGIMEEPEFRKKSEVSISGVILYKHTSLPDSSFQDLLSTPVQIKVEDLIKGTLKPFLTNPDASDLLSCVAASEEHLLDVHSRHGLAVHLDLQELCLRQESNISNNCWVGDTPGSLAGLMLIHRQISGSHHQLDVYARDMKQALLLVHSLSSQWRVQVRCNSAATAEDCVETLAAELRYLHSTLQPGASFTQEQWEQVRSQLNKLELATDSAFHSYKQGNS